MYALSRLLGTVFTTGSGVAPGLCSLGWNTLLKSGVQVLYFLVAEREVYRSLLCLTVRKTGHELC